ncbi:MAG: hypothetical protein PWR20_1488 [Bacteroidales bacterium]|jgi:hypothetical protein|nr:hypothetical protein [Bacteroidales bacterium]MDN5330277.1 hypothetical protein [Bacteroidales bacterium]
MENLKPKITSVNTEPLEASAENPSEVVNDIVEAVPANETASASVDAEKQETDNIESLKAVETEAGSADEQNEQTSADEALRREIEAEYQEQKNRLHHEEIDEDDDSLLSNEEFEQIDYESLSREKLVELLESLVNRDDINGVKTQVGLIRAAFVHHSKALQQQQKEEFLAAGNREEDFEYIPDDIDHRFDAVFAIYKEKKEQIAEEIERQKQANLEAKLAILEKLRALINSEESLKKTYDEFRALQDEWRKIGIVPKSENNSLWQNYHFLVEKFFDKVRINRELRDLDMKKNLESKIELCEKAEELLLEPNVMKSFKELQRLHDKWKEIGPVPSEYKEEIWDRFRTATEKINARRREYYDKLHEDLQSNYESKKALIEKVREIVDNPTESIKEWEARTKNINELFNIWRSIGPAPRKVNDQIWSEFKSLMDQFFKQKAEFFARIKEQQMHNYNLKLDLCIQAESLMNSTDWKNTTQELIKLQEAWREIGPVPRRHSDKIWKRFRSACDYFFRAKEAHFAEIRNKEKENLRLKEELIKQVEEYPYTNDKAENLKVLKEFQRKWVEIGFVPFQEKERLQTAFRKAISQQLDKLKINPVEMDDSSFRSRIEHAKDTPEGQKALIREINFLQGKINKMTEDVTLWENNLGFLANSKNAEILRQEFEKKIEKTKQEIKFLEAKVKFLRDELNKK